MKQLAKKIILSLLIAVTTSYSVADNSFNTFDLTIDTLSALPDCLEYNIDGLCFWFDCSWYGCWVDTTLKVDHYLPDLVVTVYPSEGLDPWFVANNTIDPVDKAAGAQMFQATDGYNLDYGDANAAGSHDNNVKL